MKKPMLPSPMGPHHRHIAPAISRRATTIDASGCIVAPGLVDLAVRLREPGHEHEGMLEAKWPPPWPVASPAWSARPIPTRCWTNRAWSKC
jgi:hypothetical protein